VTAAAEESGTKGGPQVKVLRLGRLDTLARCRRAVARITRAVLAGEVATKRARVAIAGMREVRACLEAEIIEVGLRELEAQVGDRLASAPSSTAFTELVGIRKRKLARLRLQ